MIFASSKCVELHDGVYWALCCSNCSIRSNVSTQGRAIFPQLMLTPIILNESAARGQSCPSHDIRQSSRNEISSDIQAYLELLTNPGATEGSAAESCLQIAQLRPNATSDFYWIRTANVSSTVRTVTVSSTRLYCDMSNRCCQPGWTRVAFINMSEAASLAQMDLQRPPVVPVSGYVSE